MIPPSSVKKDVKLGADTANFSYLQPVRKLGLHALASALGFYKKLRVGLLECGPDPEEPDNLVYFETLLKDR